VASVTPRPLYPQGSVKQDAGCTQSRSRRLQKIKVGLPVPVMEPGARGCPFRTLATAPTGCYGQGATLFNEALWHKTLQMSGHLCTYLETNDINMQQNFHYPSTYHAGYTLHDIEYREYRWRIKNYQ
jgi:hypothetical protein